MLCGSLLCLHFILRFWNQTLTLNNKHIFELANLQIQKKIGNEINLKIAFKNENLCANHLKDDRC